MLKELEEIRSGPEIIALSSAANIVRHFVVLAAEGVGFYTYQSAFKAKYNCFLTRAAFFYDIVGQVVRGEEIFRLALARCSDWALHEQISGACIGGLEPFYFFRELGCYVVCVVF